jgi:hypothetical protein
MTVQRVNDPLGVARIDRPAKLLDARVECGVGDDSPWPQALKKLGLGDSAPALLEQMQQQLEDSRPQRHELTGAPQLAPLDVQGAIEEAVSHQQQLSSTCRASRGQSPRPARASRSG